MSEEKKNDKIELIDIIKDISITGGIKIVINAYFRWGSNKDTLIDESLISLFAFGLLILTAIMQNYDLNLQREELKATRLELKESADAQKEQKIEMDKSNKLVLRNLKQSQFFELMRLREELINALDIKTFTETNRAYIKKLVYKINNNIEINKVLNNKMKLHGIEFQYINIDSLATLKQNDIEGYNILNGIFKDEYHYLINNNVKKEYSKIVQINNIINLLLEDKRVAGSYNIKIAEILGKSINERMMKTFRENFGYTKAEIKLQDIDRMMKIKGEDDFYKIMGGKLTLEEFVEYISY